MGINSARIDDFIETVEIAQEILDLGFHAELCRKCGESYIIYKKTEQRRDLKCKYCKTPLDPPAENENAQVGTVEWIML